MVKVLLDIKIQTPDITQTTRDIINIELSNELQHFSNNLADKVSAMIKKHENVRIYKEGA